MYFLSFFAGVIKIKCDVAVRAGLFDAYHRSFFFESRLCACPDDVVDRQFVAKYNFGVVIDVNYGVKPCVCEAEVIKKRGVLTEWIYVGCIVHAHFVIA